MNCKKIFAEKVKMLRKLRNLTQEQLGERADLSYKHIGEIERENVSPTLNAMAKIARALQADLSELLTSPNKEARLLTKFLPNPNCKLSAQELDTIREALKILTRVFRISSQSK